MSLGDGYLRVAFGSGPPGASVLSGVPSSKQKFRERSVYVRLHVGHRFIAAQLIRKVRDVSRADEPGTAGVSPAGNETVAQPAHAGETPAVPGPDITSQLRGDARSAASAELCSGRIAGSAGATKDFYGLRRAPFEGGIAERNAATSAEFRSRGVEVAAA